jgi:hypothetical protein
MNWLKTILKSNDLGNESLTEALILVDILLCNIDIVTDEEKDNYVIAVIEINDLLLDRRATWDKSNTELFDKALLASKLPIISLVKLQGYKMARLSSYKAEELILYNLYLERTKASGE